MRKNLIDILSCPQCGNRLLIHKIIALVTYSSQAKEIKSGLLICNHCRDMFPIINTIPRLVPNAELTLLEKESLKKFRDAHLNEPSILYETIPTKKKRLKIIEKFATEKFCQTKFPSEKLKKRAQHYLEYSVYHAEEKEKYVKTIAPFIHNSPKVIADIGGGQGGAISCFSQYFKPAIALLIDIDPSEVEFAKLRDPYTEVIRGNATTLPLKRDSVDLLITTCVLEHIPLWTNALTEILRVSKQALIAWGPNKWFPYDLGHIDAPLVTTLPKKIVAPLAYLFHFFTRTGRSYHSIKEELDCTFYISRQRVEKILRTHGRVYNVFERFMYYSVHADYHYIGGNIKKFLKKRPKLLKAICNLLIVLGIEPMCYLVFVKQGIGHSLKQEIDYRRQIKDPLKKEVKERNSGRVNGYL